MTQRHPQLYPYVMKKTHEHDHIDKDTIKFSKSGLTLLLHRSAEAHQSSVWFTALVSLALSLIPSSLLADNPSIGILGLSGSTVKDVALGIGVTCSLLAIPFGVAWYSKKSHADPDKIIEKLFGKSHFRKKKKAWWRPFSAS